MTFQRLERYTTIVPDVNPEPRPRLADIKLEATQRAVVEAAARLFAERGYVGTTMEDIASHAGVAVQTIYNAVGSKRAVLSRMLDFTAAGPLAPTPVATFLGDRVRNEPEPERIIALLVDWFAEVNERVAPTFALIRQAAAVDPEVATLERERAERRLAGYTQAARELIGREGTAGELSVEDAAATLWIVGHPDTFRSLVLEHGWPIERYRMWLHRLLARGLLRGVDPSAPSGEPRRTC
jgi:AcrR family transcriptional regulator